MALHARAGAHEAGRLPNLWNYAKYNDENMTRHLQRVWAAGPGMDKPGTILLRPNNLTSSDPSAAASRIDLTVVSVEHGLCRYGPVVGGKNCPFNKNCTSGPNGPCEHFVLTGADLAYCERKCAAAFHFAEGAPSDETRDYILSSGTRGPVLSGLRQVLDELGLLEEAENSISEARCRTTSAQCSRRDGRSHNSIRQLDSPEPE